MHISIRHTTRYTYGEDAAYSIQSLRLTPPSFDGQKVLSWSLKVPHGELLEVGADGYGNASHLAIIEEPHKAITIEAEGELEVEDKNGIVAGLPDPASPAVFLRTTPQTMPDEAIEALAAAVPEGGQLERLHALAELIGEKLKYQIGSTHAHTSAGDALKDGAGVCQDFAHIFIAAARVLGIPARYVTGYLVVGEGEAAASDTNKPATDEKPKKAAKGKKAAAEKAAAEPSEAPELTDAAAQPEDEPVPEVLAVAEGAEAHHAWAEAYVENLGWVGFDVANGLCPTERYIRLACGLDARAAAPVRGTRKGGESETLDVEVVVKPLGGGSQQQQQQS